MHCGKTNWKILIGHGNDATVLAMNGRDRSSPESLATHQPVSKSIVRCRGTPAFLLGLRKQFLCRFRDRKTREWPAIAERGGGRVSENGKNWEMESIRKRSIARIVGRNAHHRSFAVIREHVVGDVHVNGLVSEWMKGLDGEFVSIDLFLADFEGCLSYMAKLNNEVSDVMIRIRGEKSPFLQNGERQDDWQKDR